MAGDRNRSPDSVGTEGLEQFTRCGDVVPNTKPRKSPG